MRILIGNLTKRFSKREIDCVENILDCPGGPENRVLKRLNWETEQAMSNILSNIESELSSLTSDLVLLV